MLLRLKAAGVERSPGVYEITEFPTDSWHFFPNAQRLIIDGKEYKMRKGGQASGLLTFLVFEDDEKTFEAPGVLEIKDFTNAVWHQLDKKCKIDIWISQSRKIITTDCIVDNVRTGTAMVFNRRYRYAFDGKKILVSDRLDPQRIASFFCGGDPSDYVFLFGRLRSGDYEQPRLDDPWALVDWVLTKREKSVVYEGVWLAEREGKIWVKDVNEELVGVLYNYFGEPALVTKHCALEYHLFTRGWEIKHFSTPVVAIQQIVIPSSANPRMIAEGFGVVFLEDGRLYIPHSPGELLPLQSEYEIGAAKYYRIDNTLIPAKNLPKTVIGTLKDEQL